MSEKIIAELKAELVESAQLGFDECRAADELKRKNAELEREILEFKFSPLSTGRSGSSEWRWPAGNETKHRSSATSSDGGATTSRKQALAAQFDADVDDFLRENEQLKDKVIAAEKANRELEEKLTTEMLEIATLKSGLTPSASQLKAGMQVKHLARGINHDRVKEELLREVETEKLEVASLQQALRKAKQEAAVEQNKIVRQLEEQTTARDHDIAKAEQAREKEIRRLRNQLEAAKYSRLPSVQQSPGPSELPAFGKPETLGSIFGKDEAGSDLGHESLADQLQGHFAWPAENAELKSDSGEIQRLHEELRLMQEFHRRSAGTSEKKDEEITSLKTVFKKEEVEMQQRTQELMAFAEKTTKREKHLEEEVARLQAEALRETQAFRTQGPDRSSSLSPKSKERSNDVEMLEALSLRTSEKKDEEIASLKTVLKKEEVEMQQRTQELMAFAEKTTKREKHLEEEVARLQAEALRETQAFRTQGQDRSSSLSPKSKERSDDVEMLRALAALRCVEAHWYP